MSDHLTEEQLLALLHGSLGEARTDAATHLRSCPPCASALAREAALDEVLWNARSAAPVLAAPARRRRGRAVGWLVGGAIGAGATAGLGYAGLGGLTAPSARSDMTFLLAWQNVIFYIPLAVGLLLIFGSAFGGGHHETSADHDAHVGHDHDHDHDHDHALLGKALSILGVGRVPLTIVLMMASLLFGGIGIISNTILSSLGLDVRLYTAISVAAASAGALLLTGWSARLLNRAMPTTETYLVSRHDFAGCTGVLLLPADGSSGYAQVKDPEGNVHNIKCRTTGAALAKGREILVVEYDEGAKTFVVDANPVSAKSPG